MDAEVRAKRIDRHSFMMACLKMAGTYIRIIENEIALYKRTKGSLEVQVDLQPMVKQLENLILHHKKHLDHAQSTKPIYAQAEVTPVEPESGKETKQWPKVSEKEAKAPKVTKLERKSQKLQKPPKKKPRKLLKRKLA